MTDNDNDAVEFAEAIALVESLLPGVAAPDGEVDPRWRALIDVGEFIESHPEEIWGVVACWGTHGDPDLQAAMGCCLLEHLLEYHFAEFFPRVRTLATSNPNFASTFLGCWKYGQSEDPGNSEDFDALAAECRPK